MVHLVHCTLATCQTMLKQVSIYRTAGTMLTMQIEGKIQLLTSISITNLCQLCQSLQQRGLVAQPLMVS